MSASDRVNDSYQYVVHGVIKKPVTWVLLTLFFVGQFLLNISEKSLIHKYFTGLMNGTAINLPPILNHYAMLVVVVFFLIGCLTSILLSGYKYLIFQGVCPAPTVQPMSRLLMTGFKLVIINWAYNLLPVLIVLWTTVIPLYKKTSLLNQSSNVHHAVTLSPELVHFIVQIVGGITLSLCIYVIFTMFCIIGRIRYTRTGYMFSAFEMSAIIQKISEIGWIRYILSLILLGFLLFVFFLTISIISGFIVIIGMAAGFLAQGIIFSFFIMNSILMIIGNALIFVFTARYLTVLYDSGTKEAPN